MKTAKMLTLHYTQYFQMKGRWDLYLRLKIYSIYKENRDFLGYDEVNHAVSVKWLMINGNKYITQKSMILAKVVNGNMPEFGLVKNIYLVDSSLHCLEYQPFQTMHFDRNVMAYVVEVPHLAQATELVDAEKLVDFTSYYTTSSKSQTFVQVKYHLGDVIELYNS